MHIMFFFTLGVSSSSTPHQANKPNAPCSPPLASHELQPSSFSLSGIGSAVEHQNSIPVRTSLNLAHKRTRAPKLSFHTSNHCRPSSSKMKEAKVATYYDELTRCGEGPPDSNKA
ncbi:hypothetical protein GBA52_004505 [Prunus armeniaca]|nr:hypothetical protein GBA52_004505 [Prunus armeniaca]